MLDRCRGGLETGLARRVGRTTPAGTGRRGSAGWEESAGAAGGRLGGGERCIAAGEDWKLGGLVRRVGWTRQAAGWDWPSRRLQGQWRVGGGSAGRSRDKRDSHPIKGTTHQRQEVFDEPYFSLKLHMWDHVYDNDGVFCAATHTRGWGTDGRVWARGLAGLHSDRK